MDLAQAQGSRMLQELAVLAVEAGGLLQNEKKDGRPDTAGVTAVSKPESFGRPSGIAFIASTACVQHVSQSTWNQPRSETIDRTLYPDGKLRP